MAKRRADDPPDTSQQLVTTVLYFLAAAAVLAVGALTVYVWTFGRELNPRQEAWGQFGDYLGGLLNPFLQFGALFALLVSLALTQRQLQLARDQHREERETADSLFYLEEARRGVERSLAMVDGPVNDRVTWILAARTLERALAIAALISQAPAQKVWELAMEEYRIRASEILGMDNPARSASFFYGAPLDASGTPTIADIDAAARHATAGGDLRSLSEPSIAAFWRLAQYPDQYPDPLPRSHLPAGDDIKLFSFPGLRAFVTHSREYVSIHGTLRRRPAEPKKASRLNGVPSDGRRIAVVARSSLGWVRSARDFRSDPRLPKRTLTTGHNASIFCKFND